MNKQQIKRCLLVSIVFSFISIISTTSTTALTITDNTVVDTSSLESGHFSDMSQEEMEAAFAALPEKEVDLVGKVLYPFQHPDALYFYLFGVVSIFPWLFGATLSAVYLTNKNA